MFARTDRGPPDGVLRTIWGVGLAVASFRPDWEKLLDRQTRDLDEVVRPGAVARRLLHFLSP